MKSLKYIHYNKDWDYTTLYSVISSHVSLKYIHYNKDWDFIDGGRPTSHQGSLKYIHYNKDWDPPPFSQSAGRPDLSLKYIHYNKDWDLISLTRQISLLSYHWSTSITIRIETIYLDPLGKSK